MCDNRRCPACDIVGWDKNRLFVEVGKVKLNNEEILLKHTGEAFANYGYNDEVIAAMNENTHLAIKTCNADYQQVIQQMLSEFNSLNRTTKRDVERILSSFAEVSIGNDVNPYLVEITDDE